MHRDGDRLLQLLIFSAEFRVSATLYTPPEEGGYDTVKADDLDADNPEAENFEEVTP